MDALQEILDSLVISLKKKRLLPTQITPSIYDTAWLLRIPDPKQPDRPMFPEALDYILSQQNANGSWGDVRAEGYWYEFVMNTMSAVNALKTWQLYGINIEDRVIDCGVALVNETLPGLVMGYKGSYPTAGFELVFPTLLMEGWNLGIEYRNDPLVMKFLNALRSVIQPKLELLLNSSRLYRIPSTILHSMEAFYTDDAWGVVLDWPALKDVQDKTGGFLSSPAATVVYYLKTQDPKAMKYIKWVKGKNPFLPVNYPIDNFEANWIAKMMLELIDLTPYQKQYQALITKLHDDWQDSGLSWTWGFNCPDLDDTAVAFYLLHQSGICKSTEVFDYFSNQRYEDDTQLNFYCFVGEVQSAPTHLLNSLNAFTLLDPLDKRETAIKRALERSLRAMLNSHEPGDKWHLSANYISAIGVRPLSIVAPEMLTDGIIPLLLKTQDVSGGWGYGKTPANVENTAWACYVWLYLLRHDDARAKLSRNQLEAITHSLQQGIRYIRQHREHEKGQAMSLLWLSKILYRPVYIVDALIEIVEIAYDEWIIQNSAEREAGRYAVRA